MPAEKMEASEKQGNLCVKNTFINVQDDHIFAESPAWQARVRAFTDSAAMMLGEACSPPPGLCEDPPFFDAAPFCLPPGLPVDALAVLVDAPPSETSTEEPASEVDWASSPPATASLPESLGASPMLACWGEPELPAAMYLGGAAWAEEMWAAAPYDYDGLCYKGFHASLWWGMPLIGQGDASLDWPSAEALAGMAHSATAAVWGIGLSGAAIGGSGLETQEKTTLMLRNLPAGYTRQLVQELLEDEGFDGCFDFVYMPMDFNSSCGLGYCFVNFVSASDASRCWQVLDGYAEWTCPSGSAPSDKVCEVRWSEPQQGLLSNIERYRNSPVMHASVPDLWKPALFQSGARLPFPLPTKAVKAPKLKGRAPNQVKQ